MKKTGKALIGVLSVAALVGTGVATWTINGGIVSETTGPITPTIAEIGTRDIAIEVTAKDSTLVFDAVDDLKVIYNVKAKAGTGAAAGFEPYGYDFKNIVPEYQPNLSITTQVLRNGSPIDENDPFFDFVEVPNDESETKISYLDWLNVELKDKGYDATLTFAWGAETGGLNPQEYVDLNSSIYNTPELQRDFFERVNAALDKITFTFTFKVGGLKDTPVETPDTGEITIPKVEGSTLTIDGMTGNTVEAGTHRITITTEEGKEVADKKLTVIENGTPKPDVTLTEETLTRASGHTYYVDYEFKADTTYSFEYTLKDEEVLPTLYTVTYTQPDNGIITLKNGDADVADGAQVEENANLTLTVTANDGYEITSILVNDTELEAEKTYQSPYTTSLTINEATTIKVTIEEVIDYSIGQVTEVNQTYTVRGKVVAKNTRALVISDGNDSIYLFDRDLPSQYEIGDFVEATGKVTSYNKAFQMSFENDLVVTKIDEQSYTFNEPTTLTSEIVESWITAENFATSDIKEYTWQSTATKSGNYFELKVAGSDTSIQPVYIESSLYNIEEGKTYNVTAYFIGYYNYANIVITSLEEIEPTYDPVESVSITNTETELEVGKTLKLTSKVLPETANQEVTYSITSGDEYATLKGDVLTGVAEGEVIITVKSSDEKVTDDFSLTIIASSHEENLIYEYNYGEVTFSGDSHGHTKADGIMDAINYVKDKGLVSDGIITSVSDPVQIYYNNSHENLGIKMGSNNNPGSITLNLNTEVTSLKMTVIAWNKHTPIINVNGQEFEVAYGDGNTQTTLNFEFTLTNTITIKNNGGRQAFGIVYMAFYN